MTLELFILGMYFLFLLSLLYLANNIQYYANHPVIERFAEKFRYNLRDLPRVDYKEISDEDETLESSPSEEEETSELRNRREKNPISRIINEALN